MGARHVAAVDLVERRPDGCPGLDCAVEGVSETSRPDRGIDDLVGLAFSGGGIRSASFNLGVLQGLASRKALWMFDYLSTVSGGGFIDRGGARGSRARSGCPATSSRLPRSSSPSGARGPVACFEDRRRRRRTRRSPTARSPRHGTIPFTSSDSLNYLTPRKGALSPDTWRLVAFFIRNLLFTWMTLLPILLAAVMVGNSYSCATKPSPAAFCARATGRRRRPPPRRPRLPRSTSSAGATRPNNRPAPARIAGRSSCSR